MQRAEEGAFFSGGPEIQRGANGHTYFASVRTGTTVLKGPVWFLGLFLDRSDRIGGISERTQEPIEPYVYFKFPAIADVF